MVAASIFIAKAVSTLIENFAKKTQKKISSKLVIMGKNAHKTPYYALKRACIKKNKHDAANDKKFLPKENYKCQEQDCSFSYYLRLVFQNHLKNFIIV